MRRFPHGGEVLGASPANPLLAPVLRPEMVLSRQQALLDQQAIQRIPGLAGYWSADPAYIYQDSAGTIAASVGGVVGSWTAANPVYTLGSEANTSPTTWTVSADVTNNGDGSYSFSPNASFERQAALNIGALSGVLRVEFTITNYVSGYLYLNYRTTNYIIPFSGNGTYVRNIIAGTPAVYNFVLIAVASTSLTVSNISIKPATTNAAYQTTTANKPYLRRTPTSNVYWLDSNTSTSALTATLGNLGSSCTVAKADAEGVTFTENVTISSTYNIAPAFGFNGDVAIFNRALTTTEKVLLTRYMQRGVPVLGANLIVNGTFDTDITGWTNPTPTRGTISWDSGQLKIDGTAGNGSAPMSVSTAATAVGTSYLIRYAFSTPDGSIGYSAIGGVTIYGVHLLTNGQYSATLHKTTGDNSFSVYGTGLKVSYFDNISLKAIL